MSIFYKHIKFCQFCGEKYLKSDFNSKFKSFNCHSCQKSFFSSSSPAAAAIISLAGNPYKILMTRRNIDPGKGKLDLPGGFLNLAESPKDGVIREVKEELNINVKVLRILDSIAQKKYVYQGFIYRPLITYFICEPVKNLPKKLDKGEIKSIVWKDIREIGLISQYAFPEDLKAIKLYKNYLKKYENI